MFRFRQRRRTRKAPKKKRKVSKSNKFKVTWRSPTKLKKRIIRMPTNQLQLSSTLQPPIQFTANQAEKLTPSGQTLQKPFVAATKFPRAKKNQSPSSSDLNRASKVLKNSEASKASFTDNKIMRWRPRSAEPHWNQPELNEELRTTSELLAQTLGSAASSSLVLT